jgi:hypothetical protein
MATIYFFDFRINWLLYLCILYLGYYFYLLLITRQLLK